MKGSRRLLLSLVKIEIRQGHLDRAEYSISELLDIYSKVDEPDVNDRVRYVRTLIAKARISPLGEAKMH